MQSAKIRGRRKVGTSTTLGRYPAATEAMRRAPCRTTSHIVNAADRSVTDRTLLPATSRATLTGLFTDQAGGMGSSGTARSRHQAELPTAMAFSAPKYDSSAAFSASRPAGLSRKAADGYPVVNRRPSRMGLFCKVRPSATRAGGAGTRKCVMRTVSAGWAVFMRPEDTISVSTTKRYGVQNSAFVGSQVINARPLPPDVGKIWAPGAAISVAITRKVCWVQAPTQITRSPRRKAEIRVK